MFKEKQEFPPLNTSLQGTLPCTSTRPRPRIVRTDDEPKFPEKRNEYSYRNRIACFQTRFAANSARFSGLKKRALPAQYAGELTNAKTKQILLRGFLLVYKTLPIRRGKANDHFAKVARATSKPERQYRDRTKNCDPTIRTSAVMWYMRSAEMIRTSITRARSSPRDFCRIQAAPYTVQ